MVHKMKKIKLFGIILLSLLVAVFVAGCGDSSIEYKNNVRVVYELEGGVYKNSTRAVECYFGFERGGEYAIKSVEDMTKVSIEKSGYHIEGWYMSKTETDGEVSYDGKWDFTTDKVAVDKDGKISYTGKSDSENLIRLYARWVANVKYEYNVGYIDDDNNFVSMGTVSTTAGSTFSRAKYEIEKLDSAREGYTSLGKFYKYDAAATDGKGEEIADNFTFKESNEDVLMNVVVEYVKGNFRIVTEAKDITSNASSDKNKNMTLYLMNDVDLAGKTVDLSGYNGIRGNGHTLSDFTVSVTSYIGNGEDDKLDPDGNKTVHVEVSVFGDLTDGEVSNVTLDKVKFSVRASKSDIEKIYFAPLCMRASGVTFNNVTVNVTEFTIEISYLHELDEEGFINDAPDGKMYYTSVNGVTETNCTASVCDKTEKQ